jgi:hypothetical protein
MAREATGGSNTTTTTGISTIAITPRIARGTLPMDIADKDLTPPATNLPLPRYHLTPGTAATRVARTDVEIVPEATIVEIAVMIVETTETTDMTVLEESRIEIMRIEDTEMIEAEITMIVLTKNILVNILVQEGTKKIHEKMAEDQNKQINIRPTINTQKMVDTPRIDIPEMTDILKTTAISKTAGIPTMKDTPKINGTLKMTPITDLPRKTDTKMIDTPKMIDTQGTIVMRRTTGTRKMTGIQLMTDM